MIDFESSVIFLKSLSRIFVFIFLISPQFEQVPTKKKLFLNKGTGRLSVIDINLLFVIMNSYCKVIFNSKNNKIFITYMKSINF